VTEAVSGAQTAALRLIWMDDEVSEVQPLGKLLVRERNDVSLNFAASIDEATELYDTNGFAGIIVDCKMDPYDRGENGAAFLVNLNRRDKSFPTFVYSAFLDDPDYAHLVQRSYAIRVLSKTANIARPLLQNPFFAAVVGETERLAVLRKVRPEAISFGDFVRHPELYSVEVGQHWDKHGHWIAKEMDLGRSLWAVVCGDEIVKASEDLSEFPSEEELHSIGQGTNLIPFAYSAALLPEEGSVALAEPAAWSTTNYRKDRYPTVRVRLGDEMLVDDFDTGAVQTFASDQIVRRSFIDVFRRCDVPHMGASFRFFTKRVDATIFDENGVSITKQLTVAVVENWDESPFKAVNVDRRALFGRDLLREFNVEFVLDSRAHQTRVRFLVD
jgi:hypothetical protein